jgi:flagellar assembly factor FliW
MALLETRDFGRISYQPETVIVFPEGLPGFEARREFLALAFPETAPLIYLQSLEDPGLCFIAMPVLAVDPRYRLSLQEEDLRRLGLATDRQPRIGDEVVCLSILSIRETGPTANLLAPVVIHAHTRTAVQAVIAESGYSHQHVLLPEEAAVCS